MRWRTNSCRTHDDEGVDGERVTERLGGDLALRPGIGREAGVELRIAHQGGDRDEGEQGPQLRVSEERTIGDPRGGSLGGALDPVPGMTQRAEEDHESGQVAERVEQVERGESAGTVDVDEPRPDDAADADAEVEQREVHAEVALAQLARDEVADEGVRRRPDDAEAVAEDRQREGGLAHGRRAGQQHVGDGECDETAGIDPAGSDSVDERPDGRDDGDAHARLECEQQPHGLEGDAADLVEVDDHERQDEARADRLEDDRRDEQLAVAGQVMPERREPRCGGGRAGHPPSLAAGTDGGRAIFPQGRAPVACPTEDSHSGLVRTIGNRVGIKPSGVQIPHPPPTERTPGRRGPFCLRETTLSFNHGADSIGA